eukprot:jgi/Bigna1/128291/aug1.6_g2999
MENDQNVLNRDPTTAIRGLKDRRSSPFSSRKASSSTPQPKRNRRRGTCLKEISTPLRYSLRRQSSPLKGRASSKNRNLNPTDVPRNNVNVVVRCRPLLPQEKDENAMSIRDEVVNVSGKSFSFDQVYGENTSQAQIYEQVCKPLANLALKGYNTTIFAYVWIPLVGQTSSGKTHTMTGDLFDEEMCGIVPRMVNQLFQDAKADGKLHIFCVSYMEIYNEKVYDLLPHSFTEINQEKLVLHERESLEVKGTTESGFYVPRLRKWPVQDQAQMLKFIECGMENRSIGSTDMNQTSSRSHSVLTIYVERQVEAGSEGGETRLSQPSLSFLSFGISQ